MLGVMMVRKDEMKFREFDRYRGFYCGLCRAIGKRRRGAVSEAAVRLEKKKLTREILLQKFAEVAGKHEDSDKMLPS